MTLPARKPPPLKGRATPRVAPPLPLKTLVKEYVAAAKSAGIALYPWQRTAAQYLMARRPGGQRWLYREVAIVAARQNGKTLLLVPRILWGLQHGRRMIHTAQNRVLPREAFMEVARLVDPNLLSRAPRFANGQERMDSVTGGSYRIVAPQKGVRGLSGDDLIIDELLEFTDYDFLTAASPILAASSDPQTIYLSNAGRDDSLVLNTLRDATAERLAYLEWSADPDLDPGDLEAWVQANPALGHRPNMIEELEYAYETKTPELFETEHLCRWVHDRSAPLVRPEAWEACRTDRLDNPTRPGLGIALDSSGGRTSAVLAWQQADGTYAVHPLLDEDSADVDDIGPRLRRAAMKQRARNIAFGGATDMALGRHLPAAKALDGREYANASSNFRTLVQGGLVRWVDGDRLAEDLTHVITKPAADGSLVAVKNGDQPVTAALAAIRALWLASAPRQVPRIG